MPVSLVVCIHLKASFDLPEIWKEVVSRKKRKLAMIYAGPKSLELALKDNEGYAAHFKRDDASPMSEEALSIVK